MQSLMKCNRGYSRRSYPRIFSRREWPSDTPTGIANFAEIGWPIGKRTQPAHQAFSLWGAVKDAAVRAWPPLASAGAAVSHCLASSRSAIAANHKAPRLSSSR